MRANRICRVPTSDKEVWGRCRRGVGLFLFLVALSNAAYGVELEYAEACIHRLHAQAPGGDSLQFGRGLPFDLLHVKIEIDIDMENESISGVASNTVVAIAEPVSEIVLDSVNLDIASVTLSDGRTCDYEVTADKLKIFLPEPLEPDEVETLAVAYSGKPSRGVHFRTERMGYAPREVQMWSQGEPNQSRHWFPTYDFPNDKATSEVIATVAEPFIALSNGKHVSTFPNSAEGTRTYHWQQSYPHSTYLITLVVGEFDVVDDSRYGVPIMYYVQRGKGDDAKLSLGKTPEMIRFFEEKIGVPYPYAKYGQVAVTDFTAGGMENTSLTTLTEGTIHDAAAHLTYSSDSLVAHEAAHQWWGDLLTCRDWSHLWLNEGFATYFDALFVEEDRGQDDFLYTMLADARSYRRADRGNNRAPVVARPTEDGQVTGGLFGARVYQKGGWILHMIRREVGDDLFWKAMNVYCTRYSGGVVETTDLLRTLEEVTGRGMERFFDQWLYHGGYPEYNVSYAWENEKQRARVSIKQTQTVDELTPLFHTKATLRFHGDGFVHDEVLELQSLEETLYVNLPGRPAFVCFNPDGDLLAKTVFNKPKDMLLAQLEKAPSILSRIGAADGLAKHKTDNVVAALGKALAEDPFWGVRVEVAEVLGDIDNAKATQALLASVSQEDARVRVAVVRALGKTDGAESGETLVRAMKDESPYVASAAIASLAALDYQDAVGAITKALSRDSHNEVIRKAALDALVSLRSERSLGTLIDYTKPKKPRVSRGTAIAAVGRLGQRLDDKDRARKALIDLLDDPSGRVRLSAINALGTLGDSGAIEDLQRFAALAKNQGEKDGAGRAIRRIQTARTQADELKDLREQVTGFEKSQLELLDRLDDLEAQLKGVAQSPREVREPVAEVLLPEPPESPPEPIVELIEKQEEPDVPEMVKAGGWTVQVGVFGVRANAEGVKREIDTKSSYTADVVASQDGQGFTVIVGWYPNADAASEVREALSETFSFSDSFVRELVRQ